MSEEQKINAMEQYTQISQFYQNLITTLTTQSLPQIKLYLTNIAKQINSASNPAQVPSGGSSSASAGLPSLKFLSQFHSLTDLLNNLKQAKGKLPIHYAVASNRLELVQYLLDEHKVDPKAKDKAGNDALFTAIEHGHIQIIQYLVENVGISANTVKDGNIGVLHVAANRNNVQILNYFLNKGCDIQRVSIEGKPINWAVGSRSIQATKLLLQWGADANGDNGSIIPAPLIIAVDYQCEQLYQALINAPKPADIKVKDPNGYSLLHLAAEKGNIKLVKQLIAKGLDVNLQVEGKTPLALAFTHNKWEVVSQLRKCTKNSQQIQSQLSQPSIPAIPVIPVDKPLSESLKLQANKLFTESSYQKALEIYLKAISYNPENDAILRNIAACYLHLKKYEDALIYCHKAKQIDGKNIKNLYRMAQAYIGIGNYVDAVVSLWECAMLEPQTPFFRIQFQKYVAVAREQEKKKREQKQNMQQQKNNNKQQKQMEKKQETTH